MPLASQRGPDAGLRHGLRAKMAGLYGVTRKAVDTMCLKAAKKAD